MPRVIRTPAAEDDLWEILLYVARDNEDAAFRLIDTIDKNFTLLAEFPSAGPARPELLANIRSFPVGSYLIFYQPIDDGIEVVRVVHGARNLRRLFKR
ncbi:MAG: toxin ParE1/3/4 [Phycisphaerales bacterium]|jgi:toxin ParE1/3/4|nr:toxin ParE1/3/4 [Phycisphaerales bacterium]